MLGHWLGADPRQGGLSRNTVADPKGAVAGGHSRFCLEGDRRGAPPWLHSGFTHILEKHLNTGTPVWVCWGSFVMVAHKATNSTSESLWPCRSPSRQALMLVIFLYLDCKQQWEEHIFPQPSLRENLLHQSYFSTHSVFSDSFRNVYFWM